MSIQTELTRLTDAKAAIQTAIEGKGVTVPSGTLLDGMAALIESIEAGGIDLGQYFTDIAVASITPAEDCNLLDGFKAGFGVDSSTKLNFCLVVANNTYRKSIDGNHVRLAIKVYFVYEDLWRILYGTGTAANNEKWTTNTSLSGGSTYKLKAGIPYEMINIIAPY